MDEYIKQSLRDLKILENKLAKAGNENAYTCKTWFSNKLGLLLVDDVIVTCLYMATSMISKCMFPWLPRVLILLHQYIVDS